MPELKAPVERLKALLAKMNDGWNDAAFSTADMQELRVEMGGLVSDIAALIARHK